MFRETPFFKEANSINELSDVDALRQLFGPINKIEKRALKTSGFSGSAHEKIVLDLADGTTISLILKIIIPAQDMTIWRSGNIPNREVRLLDCIDMAEVWNIFEPPYIAFALEMEKTAVLMFDVSSYLFPDARTPIDASHEHLILRSLARMHAYFWGHTVLSKPWLAKQEIFFSFLGPLAAEEERKAGRQHAIFANVDKGWNLVFRFLPAELSSFILNFPIKKITSGLSKTLIHGDSKIANYAIMPNEKVAAFDWTMVAAASPACEIGWYIAVNASRLSTSKENILNRYRELLQNELGRIIDNAEWERMEDLAVMTGAMTLLWNKALNLEKNIAGAKEEWRWWVDNLRRCDKYR
ncbi:MAG TPA: hypothetical protein VFP87_04975 [Chitinophagaceae bacterium]|nr:hypothetical protein [Chitinophagaceae bacterium]